MLEDPKFVALLKLAFPRPASESSTSLAVTWLGKGQVAFGLSVVRAQNALC